MNDTNYSQGLLSAIKLAKTIARDEKHSSFGVAHLIVALFNEPTSGLTEVLDSITPDIDYVVDWFEVYKEKYTSSSEKVENIMPDSELEKILDEAERSKIKLGTDCVDAICIFTAVVREGVIYSTAQIDSIGISEKDILNHYNALVSDFANPQDESKILSFSPFLLNLKTEKILNDGTLVLGRERESRAILENLERSENKGILLIGDSGVGKTAVISAFVRELCTNQDELINNTAVISLNVPRLLATSSSDNEISKKLLEVFDKLNSLDNRCVLVIDDLQVLMESSSGKPNAIINVLNSQINDGSFSLVLSMTNDSFRKSIEKHPIAGKLDIILLDESEHLVLLKCLEEHKERLAKYYNIKIDDNAIEELITLSMRYFKEKKLPYGAIDLLDRTIAAVRLSNKNSQIELKKIRENIEQIESSEYNKQDIQFVFKTIFRKMSVILSSKVEKDYALSESDTKEQQLEKVKCLLSELEQLAEYKIESVSTVEIEAVVAESTGIPIGKIQAEEKERLLGIEQKLQERVKGQENAINTLSDAIIESRGGLSNPKQPIGSFFFLGPTGTGKTELTKSLAELLFDDEAAMIRFDMSEFKEEHSAALLYGAPPGYVGYEEGGMLVNKIRQKPYSVVLFDEIEKAHSSVYDVFLQIMDEGTIHDKLGRDGDFSNSIIIFTSNIGSQWIVEQFEQGKVPKSNELIEVMSGNFRPEFLGRLTEVVPFAPINEKIAGEIFELHLSRLQQQLRKQKKIELSLSDEALQYLSAKGYSKKYGARPVAGVIRTYIKKVVSRLIVAETIGNGDTVLLDYKNGELIWEKC